MPVTISRRDTRAVVMGLNVPFSLFSEVIETWTCKAVAYR